MSRTTCVDCARAVLCPRVGAPRTDATATTPSTSPIANSSCRRPASRFIPRCCSPPLQWRRTRSGARAGGDACCSCAPATARVRQIAEALLEHTSGGTVNASSAGSHPKPLHANAVRVMRTRGIDISGNRTKHLNEFVSQRFDCVITLCDRVREVCPEFLSHPELVHWSMPDPAREGTTNRASYPAFERTAAELATRIRFLLPLLIEQPNTKTRRSSHVEH